MKIAVAGQLDKQRIADLVTQYGGDKVNVTIMGDIEAAMAIKSGEQDYYIGACKTGGGGALSMAIAMLGVDLCVTLSMPGTVKSDDEILAAVAEGKKAFGFTDQHIDTIMPVLMKGLLEEDK